MTNGVSVVIRCLTMRIAGIDASTSCTGVAINDNGKLIYHNKIDMKNNKDAENRMLNMMYEIGKFIKEYSPDVVYVEDSWNKQNIETTKMLSNIIGAIMYVCRENNIKFIKILPSSWRKTIGITLAEGKVKVKRYKLKDEAVNKVFETHGIKCGDDEAEGICIADAGYLLQQGVDLFD